MRRDDPRSRTGWRTVFGAVLTLLAAGAAGCDGNGTSADVPGGDARAGDAVGGDAVGGDATGSACPFTGDGVCDEPANCPLGTDEMDCRQACEAEERLHLNAAACAYRDDSGPDEPDGLGSGGDGHLTGHIDGTLTVPSGEELQETAERHYRLYVPDAYDPDTPTPLVISMSGHRVSHYVMSGFTQLPRTADLEDFIVVYPEQAFRWDKLFWSWWTDWSKWEDHPQGPPDLRFLDRLVARLAGEYNIDRTRIFTSGHSRGAAMALIAAFERPGLFAGACVQSGFTEFGYLDRIESWDGERKPTLFFFHGVEDPDVPVNRTDIIVDALEEKGWTEEELRYRRLDNVTHRWQPQLNQQWYDFLAGRPLPEGRVAELPSEEGDS